MNQEDLDELMTMKRATRMAAEEILFELEAAPSGTVITTRQQLQKALGPDGKATVDDLFDLHAALHLLAATHGLVLDASDRGGADVGLPFNLDYTVRHLPDVLANSHVANENPPRTSQLARRVRRDNRRRHRRHPRRGTPDLGGARQAKI